MTNENITQLFPQDFSDTSKVWIFQSNRPFSEQEISEINMQLEHFYMQWTAHQMAVKGWAQVVLDRFIVVLADEQASNMVSGCSTDSMVRVMKSLEKQYSINLFDRLVMNFLINGKVQALPYQQLAFALDNQYVTGDTLFFNNLVDSKKALMQEWLVPLNESWLKTRFPQIAN